jgi:predicted glycoside hydrolase/deacetylase ChbG (UPF0249 family)
MNTKLLVVNADDLGYSRHVNDRIFGLMSRGEVTSATILANAPSFEDAIERHRGHSDCSFGVHLNCTEFKPLTDHAGLAPLLDANGCFSVRPSRVRPTLQLLQGVYGEWCAQIDRVIQRGVPFSHIDSHEHIHTIPQLFPVLKAVQAKYRIRAIRQTVNVYAQKHNAKMSLRCAKNAWNTALKRIWSTKTTDLFLPLETLFEVGPRQIRFRTAEIMTHPGAPVDIDSDVLLSDWRSALPFPVRLVNYRDLASAA